MTSKSKIGQTPRRFCNILHLSDVPNRDRLYTGIAKDVQRQQQHKIENTFRLQQQIELTKHLKEKEAAQIANAEDKHWLLCISYLE